MRASGLLVDGMEQSPSSRLGAGGASLGRIRIAEAPFSQRSGTPARCGGGSVLQRGAQRGGQGGIAADQVLPAQFHSAAVALEREFQALAVDPQGVGTAVEF